MSTVCPGGVEILRGLRTKAGAQRLPLAGSLALTHHCNARCVHCYAAKPVFPKELGTDRMIGLIDEIADAGCLFLLLTGGEPLVRPDFKRLYTRIRERGMLASVFTNGSLVDEDTMGLFRELPPRIVDVTLYGYTEDTYRRVTGVSGMRAKVWTAVERLIASGIRVAVKTVVLSLNCHEFRDIEAQARDWGVRFRMDGVVFPRMNGDRTPLQYRLQPEEVVALEFSDRGRTEQWRSYCEKQGVATSDDRLYRCAAGVWSFHLDPTGNLQPCLMAPHIARSVKDTPFREAWRCVTEDIASRRPDTDSPCASCAKRLLCGYCPPFAQLEVGNEGDCSDYLCLIGKARAGMLTGG